jgi:hypothetical protein
VAKSWPIIDIQFPVSFNDANIMNTILAVLVAASQIMGRPESLPSGAIAHVLSNPFFNHINGLPMIFLDRHRVTIHQYSGIREVGAGSIAVLRA